MNVNSEKRKRSARKARENSTIDSDSIEEHTVSENINVQEIANNIIEKLKKDVTYEDMITILEQLENIIYEKESDEIINLLRKMANSKRKNAILKADSKVYNNIQIFEEKDAPIMGFCEKIKGVKNKISIAMSIGKTIEQYRVLERKSKYTIKKKYLEEAIIEAHKKYKFLDLLHDKKINIFITGMTREDYKSYLYNLSLNGVNSFFDSNEALEIFVYADIEAIFTVIRQFGLITNSVLCGEEEPVPKGFISVNKKIKVDLLKAPSEDRITVFADIFATTAMYGTKFQDLSPFTLKGSANRALEEYFIKEIEKQIKVDVLNKGEK